MVRITSPDSKSADLFNKFRRELARMHDPVSLSAPLELVPVKMNVTAFTRADASEEMSLKESVRNKLGEAKAEGTNSDKSEPKEPETAGPLAIKPKAINCHLPYFGDQYFQISAPGSHDVELVWNDQRNGQKQAVWMEDHGGRVFYATVGLSNGHYLTGFRFNGCTRPDPTRGQRLIMNRDGVFTPITLSGHCRSLCLTNQSLNHERVLLETDASWILPKTREVDLAAGRSTTMLVHFDPSAMEPGLNEGLLRLHIQRGEELAAAGVVHVAVHLEAGGAVPDISFEPREFGEVMQGMDELQLLVEVRALGRGRLTGMISLPHSGELADFELDADSEVGARYDHLFHIDTAQMSLPQPNSADAVFRVRILTDSFLSNHRLREFEIPYRLVYLKKSLPALSFGNVRPEGTKTMRLEVARSDKQDIELSVELPPGAEKYLEAYPARPGTYVFRFDAGALPPGSSVSETIELTDNRSGLRGQIKVLATVASATAEQIHAVAN